MPGGVMTSWSHSDVGVPIQQVTTRRGAFIARKDYAWRGTEQLVSRLSIDASGGAEVTRWVWEGDVPVHEVRRADDARRGHDVAA
jgi:hypothetical protein